MKIINTLLVLVIVLILVGAFMLTSCEVEEQEAESLKADLQIIDSGEQEDITEPQLDLKEIDIRIDKNRFYPAYIEVEKDEFVMLKITSDDNTGFELDGYKVRTRVPKNMEIKVAFVADKAGSFAFTCGDYCLKIKDTSSMTDCDVDSDCTVDDEECLNGVCMMGDDADVLGTRLLRGKLVVN